MHVLETDAESMRDRNVRLDRVNTQVAVLMQLERRLGHPAGPRRVREREAALRGQLGQREPVVAALAHPEGTTDLDRLVAGQLREGEWRHPKPAHEVGLIVDVLEV